jgi:hypothetical protein
MARKHTQNAACGSRGGGRWKYTERRAICKRQVNQMKADKVMARKHTQNAARGSRGGGAVGGGGTGNGRKEHDVA